MEATHTNTTLGVLRDFRSHSVSDQSTHWPLSFERNPAEQEKCETIGNNENRASHGCWRPLTQRQVLEGREISDLTRYPTSQLIVVCHLRGIQQNKKSVRQSDRMRIVLRTVDGGHSHNDNTWSAARFPISLGIGPVNALSTVV
jgi:hypothetical protein